MMNRTQTNRTPGDRPGAARLARRALVAAAALGLLLAPAGSALAQHTHSSEGISFVVIHDWRVLVDGEPLDRATLYSGRETTGMLILSPALGGATFARIADKKVVSVDPTKIHVRGEILSVDGHGAFGRVLGDWAIDGAAAEFTIDGKRIRIEPKPIFVGEGSVQEVLQHSPEYKTQMARYSPDPAALNFISDFGQPLDIEVYFGSWCSVCKQYLPQFLRTITAGANPNIQVTMVGLPRGFSKESLAKEKRIKGIPCVIVLKDGEEVGRIEGRPLQSYEKDLGGLLRLVAGRG